MKKKKKGKKKQNIKLFKNQKNIIIIISIVIGLVACFLLFNNSDKPILKSEYSFGEEGYIDNIEVKLTDAVYINNESGIEITFQITNKKDNTITIIPDKYFVFYDINKVQIPNKYTNNNNIIKKSETINYKLQNDVTKKELYEIYFYSQIVENNIKFTFKSSDIRSNEIENDTEDLDTIIE